MTEASSGTTAGIYTGCALIYANLVHVERESGSPRGNEEVCLPLTLPFADTRKFPRKILTTFREILHSSAHRWRLILDSLCSSNPFVSETAFP